MTDPAPPPVHEVPDTATIGEVRDWLREHVEKGAECPLCHQFAKVYRRTITSAMARALVLIWHEGGWGKRLYVHVPSIDPARGGDVAKLEHWGLIEEERVARPDGGRGGLLAGHPARPGLARRQGLGAQVRPALRRQAAVPDRPVLGRVPGAGEEVRLPRADGRRRRQESGEGKVSRMDNAINLAKTMTEEDIEEAIAAAALQVLRGEAASRTCRSTKNPERTAPTHSARGALLWAMWHKGYRAGRDRALTERSQRRSEGIMSDDEATITRRQWLTRQAILNGAAPNAATEAVASVAMEHDWDMDEKKTMTEWQQATK